MQAVRTRAPDAVRVVSTLEDLAVWEDSWRELAELRGNPFITPDWYRTWLQHHADEAEPFAIVSGADDGSCLGVLPLIRLRSSSGLRFAGGELGDHFHPACRDEDEAAFTRDVIACLREASKEWSTLVLHGTEIDSSWLGELRSRAAPMSVVTGTPTPMPYVDMRGLEWDAFWADRGRKLRKYVRSRTNQVTKNHDVVYRRTSDPATLDADMSTMLQLHEQRFGEASVLLDPVDQAFHRSFAAAALERGWLRLVFMELDGEPVAASYGWRLGSRYGDYNGGFAPAWAKTSVGLLLMVHTMRAALEEGAEEYDFLLGDERYKSRFTSSRRQVATVLVGPRLHPRRLAFSAEVGARKMLGRLPSSTADRLTRPLRPWLRRVSATRDS